MHLKFIIYNFLSYVLYKEVILSILVSNFTILQIFFKIDILKVDKTFLLYFIFDKFKYL